MTIHSAKGLEFENVFIVGMERTFPRPAKCLFPFRFGRRERLFYVALTRAEKRVIMTYSTSRYKNGNVVYPQLSRFIAEIDPHYLDGFSPRPVPPWDARYTVPEYRKKWHVLRLPFNPRLSAGH